MKKPAKTFEDLLIWRQILRRFSETRHSDYGLLNTEYCTLMWSE